MILTCFLHYSNMKKYLFIFYWLSLLSSVKCLWIYIARLYYNFLLFNFLISSKVYISKKSAICGYFKIHVHGLTQKRTGCEIQSQKVCELQDTILYHGFKSLNIYKHTQISLSLSPLLQTATISHIPCYSSESDTLLFKTFQKLTNA